MGMTNEGMFHRICDFSYARNARQALGFYLFHVFIGVVLFVLLMAGYAYLAPQMGGHALSPEMQFQARGVLAILYVGVLSVLVLRGKNRLREPMLCLIAAAGVWVSGFGALLGLLPVACMSILRPNIAPQETNYISKEEQQ